MNERVFFLDDSTYTDDQARSSPVDLGAFPHQCLGNVSLCPNGFTLAFWYKPLATDNQVDCLIFASTTTVLSNEIIIIIIIIIIIYLLRDNSTNVDSV